MPFPLLAWVGAAAAVAVVSAVVASDSDSDSDSDSSRSYDEENRKEKERAQREAEKAQEREKKRIALEGFKSKSNAFIERYYDNHPNKTGFKADINKAENIQSVKRVIDQIDEIYSPSKISDLNKEIAKLRIKDKEFSQAIELLKKIGG